VSAGHQAKLVLLTRHARHPAPECLRGLRDVEQALLDGLQEDAAVQLLRQRLEDTLVTWSRVCEGRLRYRIAPGQER
jgi:hypothetical protein